MSDEPQGGIVAPFSSVCSLNTIAIGFRASSFASLALRSPSAGGRILAVKFQPSECVQQRVRGLVPTVQRIERGDVSFGEGR
jgi:hypothetical protein